MNKKIFINDKSAISKLKKTINKRTITTSKKWENIDEYIYQNHNFQLDTLKLLRDKICISDNILINKNDKENDKEKNQQMDCINIIRTEIQKKITSYKSQDIEKTKYEYNEKNFVTMSYILDLLLKYNMSCHYCKKNVVVIYKKVRQTNQWTLDRINNDIGHNIGNCVICCLRCNIQRRLTEEKRFLFTKQLNIVKCDYDNEIDEIDEIDEK